MEPIMLTREEFEARHNGIKQEPEWWKKTRTYEVQMLEGREWVTKMSSDYEFVEDFRIVAKSSYARILKNGIDVTEKYRDGETSSTSPYGAITPLKGPMPTKRPSTGYMKPAEYKALPIEEKRVIWEKVATLLEQKAKRAEIFETLSVSEATYDTIRLDIKEHESAEHVSSEATIQTTEANNVVEKASTVTDNTPKQAGVKLQRPSLLRRR